MSMASKTEFPTHIDKIIEKINNIDPVNYAHTRNYTDGAVTYLSPYISRAVITVKQVLENVVSRGYDPQKIEKFIQELCWREYWQRTWQAAGDLIHTDLKNPQSGVEHNRLPNSILAAETGIEIIDKHILQLYETGYMHNHVRMYLASICCNIGKAHWSTPAAWMYYHLLDGDLASNTLSWQWVAGSFSSKKYYCNQDNINHFTGSQQKGTFIDHDYDHIMRMPLPDQLSKQTDPELAATLPITDFPVINRSLPTLVYNSYNLDPGWRKEESANRILLLEPSHFNKFPVSEKVIRFIISLSENIPGIQVFTGEFRELAPACVEVISKEHPAFAHYSGKKEERDWISKDKTGYNQSFSLFWKKIRKDIF